MAKDFNETFGKDHDATMTFQTISRQIAETANRKCHGDRPQDLARRVEFIAILQSATNKLLARGVVPPI